MRAIILSIAVILLIGCSPTVEMPVPSETEIDEPFLSREEVEVYTWSQLPDHLPQGYDKSQFSPDTKSAVFEGRSIWSFQVYGSGEIIEPLPQARYRSPLDDGWIVEEKEEITTYQLKLTAKFYESLRMVEILDIAKFNEREEVKIASKEFIADKKELLVQWIRPQYEGIRYDFEGSVKNIGSVPLENIEVEVTLFDDNHEPIIVKTVLLDPQIIDIGELGHFLVRFMEKIDLRFYEYRFIDSSGRAIPYSEEK